jgi:hypothetical protein
MEVLHGDIRITLSDQEAIRGLERTRAAVKRGMAQRAQGARGRLFLERRRAQSPGRSSSLKKRSGSPRKGLRPIRSAVKVVTEHLDMQKRTNKEAALGTKQAKLRSDAENAVVTQLEAG